MAKRIARKTNKVAETITGNGIDNENAASSTQSSNEAMDNFAVGDYVRATYDDDGVDYEAEILNFEDNGYCLVKFLGYDNEQLVKVDELLPSWGLATRKKQLIDANAEMLSSTDENYEEDETGSQDVVYEIPGANKKKLKNKNKANNNQSHGGFGDLNGVHFSSSFIPPPPPMPPMLNDLTEDSEHLSAMLMSWYMSGYYTGLYQGHKMAQNAQKSSKRNKK